MSAKAEQIAPVKTAKPEERVVDFEPEQLKAPFLLRCGALLIDYILFIGVPVISLLLGRLFGTDGNKLLNGQLSNAGWLIAFLVLLTNFVIFPMISGQSIGKMLTGLRVVKADGSNASIAALLIRQLIGYPLTLLTGGLGFMLSVINAKGRALDDFISGTMVIYGQRKIK